MSKKKMPQRVEVLWVDAGFFTPGWKELGDYTPDKKAFQARSIGYAVHVGADGITLACGYDPYTNKASAAMFIPSSAVRRVRKF